MSGEPDDDQNHRREGGQRTGGQPQGGQPGGGQPQGGQPGGGQPQGGQPQAGQRRGGQTQGGHQQSNQPLASNVLQDWTKYLAILSAIGGVGMGLLSILFDAIDESLIQIDAQGGLALQQGGGVGGGSDLALAPFSVAPFIAIPVALVLGVALAGRIEEDDQMTFQIVAAGAAAGTVIFWILGALLSSVALPQGFSINFGGLIINSVIAAIVAAGMAVGGVWAARNQAPA
jgi:hypothetical protein